MKANSVPMPEAATLSSWDALAFTLELVALGSVAAWGWRAGGWLGATAAAAAFVVAWGVFLSPRASIPITGMWWPTAKFAVFGVCALALASVAGPLLAAAFLALSVLSVILGGSR